MKDDASWHRLIESRCDGDVFHAVYGSSLHISVQTYVLWELKLEVKEIEINSVN